MADLIAFAQKGYHMHRISIPSFLLCVFPVAGLAYCPTADDLMAGIRLTQTDPLVVSTITLSDGVYSETRLDTQRSDAPLREMERTHFLMAPTELAPQPRTVIYQEAPDVFDRLPELGTIVSSTIYREPNLADIAIELTLTFSGAERFEISGCEYDVWRAELSQVISGTTHYSHLAYAPELGLLLALTSSSQRFSFDQIEALE